MIALNSSLGNTRYFAIQVEFQVSGGLHIHSFIWILKALKLTKESKEEYFEWAVFICLD